jgi:tetratricopeptide (TPR) repeat protein
MSWSWVRDPMRRRSLVAVAALVFAVLSIWPRHYLASAELIPDQNGGGLPSILSGGGGALASLGALIGARQSIESDLTIARSQTVAEGAVRLLQREGLLKNAGQANAEMARAVGSLHQATDVEAITGSILQISVTDHDPAFAKAAVGAYVQAIRDRLAAISVDQSTQKKSVALDRLAEASSNLSRAQAALDRFRQTNVLADPQIELGAAISLVTTLQAKLQADEAALATLQRFATLGNVRVQALRAEIDALKSQINTAQTRANMSPGPSVGAMTPKISEYQNLYLNEKYAEAAYEIYKSYLDSVTVELLSSEINMSVVEPPSLSPNRQFNVKFVVALAMILLAGGLAEVYISRPPPGWLRHEVGKT